MKNIQDETVYLVERIVHSYHPEKVILFGSLATGKSDEGSDIDLLIIKKSKKKRPFRVKEVLESLRNVKRTYPLDAIVYTPEEIKKRLTMGDYFVTRIMNEGKVLYE
ncbi:nucleotidyltransferase domain-containing protein [Candidatus Gottesmanbacteria bacterium]|nr:nucleotidyltransferase domain-containing protein [Candidatus Gottesmanbacteria bacterium]